MNEDLKILADYCYNPNTHIRLSQIWYIEIKSLLNKDKIKNVYEISEKDTNAWYYVVTKNNMRYIVKHKLNNTLTKMMMKSLLIDKMTCTKISSELLKSYFSCKDDIIYLEAVA